MREAETEPELPMCGCIGCMHLHLFDGHADSLRRHLRHDGVRALSHFRARVVNHHSFDFAVAVDFHFGPAVFLIPERKPDIFESCRETTPTEEMLSFLFFLFSFRHSSSRIWSPPPPSLYDADRTWGGVPTPIVVAIAQGILQAEFQRIHAEFFGEFIHLQFGHVQGLWRAETAERRARHIIGVDAIHIRFYSLG